MFWERELELQTVSMSIFPWRVELLQAETGKEGGAVSAPASGSIRGAARMRRPT